MTEFQQTWANPQMRHALLVHWPVVLSILSAVFVLGLALSAGKSKWLRAIALAMCVGTMATGFITMRSGEHAEGTAKITTPEAHEIFEHHEEMAERVPVLGAVCAALVCLTFFPRGFIRVPAAWLATLACGVTAGWIAETAHAGGKLVYEHGVGLPRALAGTDGTGGAGGVGGGNGGGKSDGRELSNDPKVVFFRENVRPVLEDRCFNCHNAQRVARGKSGKLDQTTREALLRGGRSGPAIVPGKPEESLLIQRVKGDLAGEDLMPPPPKDPLKPQQIADLEQWIRDGAVWE